VSEGDPEENGRCYIKQGRENSKICGNKSFPADLRRLKPLIFAEKSKFNLQKSTENGNDKPE
jgi:hypothetical protein